MKIQKLWIIVFLCFFPMICVKAAPLDCIGSNAGNNEYKEAFSQNREICSVDNTINYDISNFTINQDGSIIQFDGWSYIDHMDNYGGKNLKTWIVAYVGTWDEAWHEAIRKGTLVSKNHYYAVLTSDSSSSGSKNLYWSRASKNASEWKEQKNRLEASINNNGMQAYPVNGRNGIYMIDWCLQHYGSVNATAWNNGKGLESRCAYYNVEFTVQLGVENIIKGIFGEGKDSGKVKFRIVSAASYQQNENCKKNYKCTGKWTTYWVYDSSDLGIYKDSCKSIFGKSCSSYIKTSGNTDIIDAEVKTGNVTRKFQSNGLANTLQVTINNAAPYTGKDTDNKYTNRFSKGVLKSISYGAKFTYTIASVLDEKTFVSNGHTFTARAYKLNLSKTLLDPGKNSNANGGYYQSGTDKVGYVPASWVKVKGTGSFTLSLSSKSEPEKSETPCDEYCIGGSCDSNIIQGSEECLNKNDSFSIKTCNISDIMDECEDVSAKKSSCEATLNETYYYKLSQNDVSNIFGSNTTFYGGVVLKDNNSYYFPISFYSDVNLYQTTNIVLNNFKDGTSVKSGQPFQFSVTVDLSASWDYQDYSTDKAKGYDKSIQLNVLKGNKSTAISIAVRLKNGDKLYSYDKDNNKYTEVVYNGADFHKKVVDNTIDSLLDKIQVNDNVVAFEDSNDATKTGFTNSNSGSFTCEDVSGNWKTQKFVSTKCSYKIYDAYVKNNGEGLGNYVYSNVGMDSNDYTLTRYGKDSSLYFVPLNLKTGFSFEFQIRFEDLSLIQDFENTYTSICSVKSYNELVPNDNNGVSNNGVYRYRQIDESNPFPNGDASIPKNWANYIEKYTLTRITQRSFSAISYQTKKNNTFIDNMSEYGIYASLKDINAQGKSIVINDSLFEIHQSVSGKNHCATVQFSDDCDKEIGGD